MDKLSRTQRSDLEKLRFAARFHTERLNQIHEDVCKIVGEEDRLGDFSSDFVFADEAPTPDELWERTASRRAEKARVA